ncbi:hypothetical protein GCM10025876_35670 [Demequina litorisediminis]|uniref:Secreted protein n=1 Tax=Demequina litorisediminis TaxID=1849022 RepID=A0ABQ6IJQ5_9MICO|nr:hypothetical protein GCM10025876_35670 [Demequina litorisediminis]
MQRGTAWSTKSLVLLVLAGVGEVQAEEVNGGALASEGSGRVQTHSLAAERDDGTAQACVATQTGDDFTGVDGVLVPQPAGAPG